MKKLLAILTAVAFAAGSLGFIGCGGIEDDPDAAKHEAGEAKPNPDDEDPDKSTDGGEGEKPFTPKSTDDPDEDGGDDE